jgi:two-component system chemotaxis sensor kinase CheA
MTLSEQIRQQLIKSFKVEQSEHVQKINEGLLALEGNPTSEAQQTLFDEIFREAHSLKGAARALGLTVIESLGHSLEDLLLSAREGRLTFSPELFDLSYQTLDAIDLLIKQLDAAEVTTPPAKVLALLVRLEEIRDSVVEEGKGADQETMVLSTTNEEEKKQPWATDLNLSPPPLPSQTSTPLNSDPEPVDLSSSPPLIQAQSDETIRVSVNKLDALMNQFGELLGAKIRAERRLTEVREMQIFVAEWQKDWQGLRSQYNRLVRNGHSVMPALNGYGKDVAALLDFVAQTQEQLRAFNVQSNTLYRQLSNDTMRLSLVIDELQEEIKRVRMLPLHTITAAFGRMVRDLAREQNKRISLTIRGGEIELDKRVLEQIKDPLIHLLRNAVDHGLETLEERRQVGKPGEGRITLSASQHGNNVVITVGDNGNGLDLSAIRQAAVRRGILSRSEAERLSDEEAKTLVFNSGLSTSEIITDISGRGVGLDVVRQNIEELHGTLDVSFEPGQGTTFTMTLPLTLASSRGLLVKVGEQVFALPHSTVERMLHIKRDDVARVEGQEAITYQGKPVALAWLADLLELPSGSLQTDHLTVVIVGVAEKRLGLIVDELVGEQEIVMKSLGKQLARVGGVAGATVLGSGQVILVLHTADLVKLAARTRSRTRTLAEDGHYTKQTKRKTILVVDDSITTRTLEKNILEAAGYRVKLATDGQEALGTLASDGLPNLIISDINMPRLDGFGLAGRVKQDKRYTDIPVILVTSLDSPADKARGIEAGADAYIVKSSFDQGNLLETIEQLV